MASIDGFIHHLSASRRKWPFATPADNRRANACWFFAKKRSWTFKGSDA
jgi:hypothetical protein